MTYRMVRWVALVLMVFLAAVSADFNRNERVKRQVTYHGDEHHEYVEDDDDQPVRPVTKKPLPTQVVYPGDLSSFYTTEASSDSPNGSYNRTVNDAQENTNRNRQKRSIFYRRNSDGNKENPRSSHGNVKTSTNKDMSPLESRLHSSYHKPSVSIMNDVPVEMSFDGAGFLRYEDESNEQNDAPDSKSRKSSRGRNAKVDRNNDRAVDDFEKVFNLTRERIPDKVKYDDDDVTYNYDPTKFKAIQDSMQRKTPDYGGQAAENAGSPFTVDFMKAYQNAFQNQFQNPFQSGMISNAQPTAFSYMPVQSTQFGQQGASYDPFTFAFPNMLSGQHSNANQNPNSITTPVIKQDSFLQNHRAQPFANHGVVQVQSMYSTSPEKSYNMNSAYQSNTSSQQNHKTRRRKRSIIGSKNSAGDIVSSASEASEGHYRRSQMLDNHDASSGFIPITGTFNGGTIQLTIPSFYGQNPISPPSYSSRPMHTVPAYSMPIHPEGRQYVGMERYYHPSEARRYSYGVLGSGNFEVIRGGVFPGERQQNYHNGYQDSRIPYSGNDYGNYGTTEIIIDGPIQGFQGFDNFPAHLINALSKHSEISLRPNRRESELH